MKRTPAQRLAALFAMANDDNVRAADFVPKMKAIVTNEQLDAMIDEWEATRREEGACGHH